MKAEKKPKKAQKAKLKKAAKPVVSADAKKAIILNFRRGRHTQRTNQFILEIAGVDTKANASQYIGRRVVWTSPGAAKKKIYGKITHPHGNNGVLRARFSRGLPGTALGKKIEILEK